MAYRNDFQNNDGLFGDLEVMFSSTGKATVSQEFLKGVFQDTLTTYNEASLYGKGNTLRASSIGKPLMVQILDLWYPETNREFNIETLMKLADGVQVGIFAQKLLEVTGYDFQSEVAVSNYGVSGHADLVVVDHDKRECVVIEVKSMASYLVNKFIKAPSNQYGYLSQLAFYHSCLRESMPDYKVTGAFLISNRDSKELNFIKITNMTLRVLSEQSKESARIASTIGKFDYYQLYTEVGTPSTIDGKILPSLTNSRWRDVMYENVGGEWYVKEFSDFQHSLYNTK